MAATAGVPARPATKPGQGRSSQSVDPSSVQAWSARDEWPPTSGRGIAAAIGAPLELQPADGTFSGASNGALPTTVRFPAPPEVAPAPPLAHAEPGLAGPPPWSPPTADGRGSAHAEPGAPPAPAPSSALAWPDAVGEPPGRRGTAASAAEVDALYEQVLERLRRDLVHERERMGQLVGDVSWGF